MLLQLAIDQALSEKLGALDCCSVLVSMLKTMKTEEDVVEEVLVAITSLCDNSFTNRIQCHTSQIEKFALEVLVQHEDSEAVVEACFLAMDRVLQLAPSSLQESVSRGETSHSLVDKSIIFDKIVYSLVSNDGCKVFSNAIARFASSSQTIVETGTRLLANIASYGSLSDSNSSNSSNSSSSSNSINSSSSRDMSVFESKIALYQSASGYHKVEAFENIHLIPLGLGSSAPTVLCTVLQLYMGHEVIVRQALTALHRMSTCVRNIPVLHSVGLDRLISPVLRTHFLRQPQTQQQQTQQQQPQQTQQPDIVHLCYRLVVNLCLDSRCRAAISTSSGGETLLVSLVHHLQSKVSAKLACDALSALCISPLCDALSSQFVR